MNVCEIKMILKLFMFARDQSNTSYNYIFPHNYHQVTSNDFYFFLQTPKSQP